MQSKALFVTLQASQGKGEAVAQWLRGAIAPIEEEPGTRDWYALRFGPDRFAIFDTFDGDRGRLAHLLGKVGRGLVVRTFTLLSGLPDIRMAEVVAARLPGGALAPNAAVYSTFAARDGRGDDIVAALRQEAEGTGWYALRLGNGSFALLDLLVGTGAASDCGSAAAKRVAERWRPLDAPAHAEVLACKLAQPLAAE